MGTGAVAAKKVKETFAEIDTDRSGRIDSHEFENAMRVLRVDLRASDIVLLFKRFDTDRNGLDYNEFMSLIGFQSSPRRLRF
jgi:Ca2+-binding EF-hand superfamily protein